MGLVVQEAKEAFASLHQYLQRDNVGRATASKSLLRQARRDFDVLQAFVQQCRSRYDLKRTDPGNLAFIHD